MTYNSLQLPVYRTCGEIGIDYRSVDGLYTKSGRIYLVGVDWVGKTRVCVPRLRFNRLEPGLVVTMGRLGVLVMVFER